MRCPLAVVVLRVLLVLLQESRQFRLELLLLALELGDQLPPLGRTHAGTARGVGTGGGRIVVMAAGGLSRPKN